MKRDLIKYIVLPWSRPVNLSRGSVLRYFVGLLALIIVMDMLTSQCAAKANLQGSNIYNTCSFIFGVFHETGIRCNQAARLAG